MLHISEPSQYSWKGLALKQPFSGRKRTIIVITHHIRCIHCWIVGLVRWKLWPPAKWKWWKLTRSMIETHLYFLHLIIEPDHSPTCTYLPPDCLKRRAPELMACYMRHQLGDLSYILCYSGLTVSSSTWTSGISDLFRLVWMMLMSTNNHEATV